MRFVYSVFVLVGLIFLVAAVLALALGVFVNVFEWMVGW